MSLVSTSALVLQAFPYSETSKILRLFTPGHGLQSVIAKGAQRPRSRFGGVLEPFTEGIAEFRLKSGHDLHTLSGWELVRSRQGLGHNLARFAGASLLAELVLRAGTEEAQPQIYEHLRSTFDYLLHARNSECEHLVVRAVWQLVALLGFAPRTDACVGCGKRMSVDEDTRFDADRGGVACAECRPTGRILPATARQELSAMLVNPDVLPFAANSGVHRALLRGFVNAQLGTERPIRSMELFLEQFGRPAVA